MGCSDNIKFLAATALEFPSLTGSSPRPHLLLTRKIGQGENLETSSWWYSWKVGHSNSHRKGLLPRFFPLYFQIRKGIRQGCILSPCLFNLYAEYIMRNWKKHKLESRLLGEISITSDMQVTPPLWQKAKRN